MPSREMLRRMEERARAEKAAKHEEAGEPPSNAANEFGVAMPREYLVTIGLRR